MLSILPHGDSVWELRDVNLRSTHDPLMKPSRPSCNLSARCIGKIQRRSNQVGTKQQKGQRQKVRELELGGQHGSRKTDLKLQRVVVFPAFGGN